MNNILFSGALAFLITFFAIPIIIEVGRRKKLFDEPDERKVHKMVTPTLGGLGIFGGFILATLMGAPAGSMVLQYFSAAAIVIFFLGIKDDILILSPTKKFIGQLLAAAIVIKFGAVQLGHFNGFLGIDAIPPFTGVLLSLFTITVIINSFNLIDGVDGLAGSLGLLAAVLLGSYFYAAGELLYAVIAFSLAGSLIGFLIYNFSPAKIFMGDTGSLLIGLIHSILIIKFINISGSPAAVIHFESAPAIGFAILIVPLMDTLRVFSFRIGSGQSPFVPDRTHVHHLMLNLGFSHRKITLLCIGFNLAMVAVAVALNPLGTTWVMVILTLLTALAFTLIYYLVQKNAAAKSSAATATPEVIKTHKIISLPKSVEAS